MKIGILGSGYVGEATGKLMNSLGNEVLFYDIEIKPHLKKEFEFSNDMKTLVSDSELIFICVPTPQDKNGEIDLSIIKSVCLELSDNFKNLGKNVPVVIKSTVVPGTTKSILKPILDNSGFDVSVGSNPEFITESHTSWSKDNNMQRNWTNEDKIVIGSEDENIKSILNKVYSEFENKIINTDTETSEMIKYASNYCLASKISFFNEIFEICKKLKIDNKIVVDALIADPRIGEYGSVNGKAYGGKCLPKDTKALQYFLRDKLAIPMLDATLKTNSDMSDKYGVRE
jgi:UDPglucose 6-dehydrogenase